MSDDHQLYNPDDSEVMPEGEEAPPPYTHTMAIVRWVLLGAMTLFAVVMVLHYFGATPWQSASAQATQYHCPMHPTYVSNQPGECPICGMNLVPIDKEGHEMAASKDTDEHGGNAGNGRTGQTESQTRAVHLPDGPGE